MKLSKHSGGSTGHGAHMATSLTDLMTSLMVLFILLFVAALNNAGASRTKVKNDLLDTLREKLAAVGLDSSAIRQDDKDPFAIIIVMPDSLLFEHDRADVRPAGESYLKEMVPTLSEILCSGSMAGNIDNVVVEGHTDTTYIGSVRNCRFAEPFPTGFSKAFPSGSGRVI